MAVFGPENPMWKGGQSVSSHGYVLIRVGVGHHLADVRGYAYQHRIVAERLLGRRLKQGEIVHHKDGNKQNNSPENLIVVGSNGEHYVFHRQNDSLQKPNEQNVLILCSCGCGQLLPKYDSSGRPRKYVSGHNMRDPKGTHYGRRPMVDG